MWNAAYDSLETEETQLVRSYTQTMKRVLKLYKALLLVGNDGWEECSVASYRLQSHMFGYCGDTVVLGHVSGGVTLLKFDFIGIDACVG